MRRFQFASFNGVSIDTSEDAAWFLEMYAYCLTVVMYVNGLWVVYHSDKNIVLGAKTHGAFSLHPAQQHLNRASRALYLEGP